MNNCKRCENNLEAYMVSEMPMLMVRGKKIGIAAPDDIMKEVRASGLSAEGLGQVKNMDCVPSSLEKDYLAALL